MKKFTTLATFAIALVISQPVFAGNTEAVPSQKQILGALVKNLNVELKDATHCNGVGVEQTDQTIGDYLSGFWTYHTSTSGKNWLDISASRIDKGHYLANLMIYRKAGEENWGWGVSFEMDDSYKVNRSSFTCLGAG